MIDICSTQILKSQSMNIFYDIGVIFLHSCRPEDAPGVMNCGCGSCRHLFKFKSSSICDEYINNQY